MLIFIAQQRRRERRWLICLAALLLGAVLLSLCAGERWFGPAAWLSDAGRLFVGEIRLPRTLAVLLVGASLAVTGTVMQTLFDNPLAEPGLLGVANGAGVALVGGVLLGQGALPGWGLSACAIAGALTATLALLRFARRQLSISRLLLAGVALGIICSALMTWAVYFSSSLDLRQLMYWMMGGFGGVGWEQGWLMIALLPALAGLCRCAGPLNLLALGEISARQLGLPLWLWRNLLVAATGWLVGVSVALAGAIGFIGLVIPHVLRLCGLSDHRALLPASALAGATTLLLADVIARQALRAAELPVGVVTATLGAPVFIWLLLKTQ
ncbi:MULTISPECIES: vitamin B12 ABC transporter permease BtuC [Tenebrionibacter/Tenebrionicola group]|jgi:vitamin B12 transport system permease protein|uniref:Vitamin B12 import system permease protein BtuC n=2 Tax=Tenebrionibacter/Tenebrionicola group TaxID=2969848 RepID=A0A8K0V2M9_9ENTR|nr:MULTISPECIES: vitamin B12 ABC transporter permease BtuC [Tenebrionibacter/Tenebrionicola group]MBK4714253.1 vitamin B12 ABC transporter permease BtuC [Tenebrionibacter intestinalis]MBV4413405.1 vitamin B12 ABC transporter permease BtuC [Tenebrionicola larvae]MBV5094290.1 vitamin B12 ABC transporter permease BtuC [Tenebrionicola larvae]